jgi:cytosine/adenosine deaminase-related metal-dependent hydrolase
VRRCASNSVAALKNNRIPRILVEISIVALAVSSAFAVAASPAITIQNVTLIDGTGVAPRAHMTVRIQDGRIAEVARASGKKVDGDVEIDGSGRYLVPGFFDNNAHLTVYGQPSRRDTSAKYGDRNEELALEFAQRTLKAGVTTLVDSRRHQVRRYQPFHAAFVDRLLASPASRHRC